MWFRLLFPSITDLIFVLLLVSMSAGILAPRLLGDASIGWHIRNGELMLRTHAITRADQFSNRRAIPMRTKAVRSWRKKTDRRV